MFSDVSSFPTLDNPKKLRLMMQDLQQAPEFFKPTNYWSVADKRVLTELEKLGLQDFRRRQNSALSSFGATDLQPAFSRIDLLQSRLFGNRITKRIPSWSKLISLANELLNKPTYAPITQGIEDCTIDDLKQQAYLLARLWGKTVGAKSIDNFEVSLVGNPEDVFEAGGRKYTMRSLYYYIRYAYCCQFIDFDRINVIVELGGGCGKQIEVIKKLHPHICFLMFDIPPQLYVCEQYLSAVFSNSVVSYMQNRELNVISETRSGSIYIFGNWQFPLLEGINVDLFWNAVSFQEMEPDVVANYLKYVNRKANYVFLQQKMDGKEVARKEGEHGVLRQTKLEHYRSGLPDLAVADISPVWQPFRNLTGYSDSFWKRVQS